MNESETDNTLVASDKSEKGKVNLFANERQRIKWALENKVQEAQDQNSDTKALHR